MKITERSFRKCKSGREQKQVIFNKLLAIRREFDKLLRNTERKYNRQKITDIEKICTGSPTSFWKCIKHLGPSNKHRIPSQVNVNGIVHNDLTTVLKMWKEEFSNLYKSSTAPGQALFYEECKSVVTNQENLMLNPGYVENDYINIEITETEVCNVIKKLKRKKACGIDGVPNEMLKNDKVMKFLVIFFNKCLSSSSIPKQWSEVIIKPIPKNLSKDQRVPLNYRGISLVSCICKVLSNIINQRIT